MNNMVEMKKNSFWEVRKFFPIIAGLLLGLTLVLPLWSVSMSAPQYPDQDLVIKVFVNKMAGDISEYNTLNQYVGVSFPDYLPEFTYLPYIVGGLAILSILTGFAGVNCRKKSLLILLILLVLLLAGGLADLQYHLYDIGHNLDPNAPMQGIGTFTPPLLGPNKVWNFHTLSLLRSGGITLGLSLILVFIAFLNRNQDILVGQWFSAKGKLFSKKK